MSPSDTRPLILVVDDDADLRDSLVCMLEAFGHRVITAADGAEGLRAVQAEHPDLVVTDIYMPESDGLELLTKLNSADVSVPVIVLSGGTVDRGLFDPLESARKLGAAAVFAKPFQPADVLNAIATLVAA
ncbi:MAG TPA: response regulator [Candidatus Cybelea sp.]|nr:response regulator [Candidatus Cybelea sp.]